MGRFKYDPEWLAVLRGHEEKLRFDTFTREDALAIGLAILRLAKEKYQGDLCVSITEDDSVVFSCKMAGSRLENDAWMLRKRNVSKLTGVSSLRAYLEVEAGFREETWLDREDSFVACGGCMPVLMRQGATFAYITVSGLEHHADHQIIADAVAEHLNIEIGSIAGSVLRLNLKMSVISRVSTAKGTDMKEKDLIHLACCRALKVKSMGCHCSQACLCALAPYVGLDEGHAMKLMAAFGGGMRHQQLCGAVVGAGTALGLVFGTSEQDQAASDRLGELTIEFVDRFTQELGTTVCGPILAHPMEAFDWDMPENMACDSACDNENGNLFNLKVPACGAAITNAVKFTLEIIQRENGLK